jgi:hypothetical protein
VEFEVRNLGEYERRLWSINNKNNVERKGTMSKDGILLLRRIRYQID